MPQVIRYKALVEVELDVDASSPAEAARRAQERVTPVLERDQQYELPRVMGAAIMRVDVRAENHWDRFTGERKRGAPSAIEGG